jgi:formylglycine-generating enzyme required for sulfatase activity/cyclophilin family peptidyl-prolyl cis-trans isomerase
MLSAVTLEAQLETPVLKRASFTYVDAAVERPNILPKEYQNAIARSFLLEWEPLGDDVQYLEIYLRVGTRGSFFKFAETGVQNHFVEYELIPTLTFPSNTPFQFQVRACRGVLDGTGNFTFRNSSPIKLSSSAASNTVQALWPGQAPSFSSSANVPSNFTATPDGDGSVRFQFSDNTNYETGYEIQFKRHSEPASAYRNLQRYFSPTSTELFYWPFNLNDRQVAINLPRGEAFDWRIRAIKRNNIYANPPTSFTVSSSPTAWAEATTNSTTGMVVPPFSPITNFRLRTTQENQIYFEWNDNSAINTAYRLGFRKTGTTDPFNYDFYSAITPGTTQAISLYPFIDPGEEYDWSISTTYDHDGNSATPLQTSVATDIAKATTWFLAPSDLKVSKIDNDATRLRSEIELTFQDNSKVESHYVVYYRDAAATEEPNSYIFAGLFPTTSRTGTGSQKVTLSSQLPPGRNLVLKVRAFDGNYQPFSLQGDPLLSDFSNGVNLTTKHTLLGLQNPLLSLFSSGLYGMHAPIVKGQFFDYEVLTSDQDSIAQDSANHYAIQVSNLPPGLRVEERSIRGVATVAGIFICPVRLAFKDGSSSSSEFQLRVQEPQLPPTKPWAPSEFKMTPGQTLSIPLASLYEDRDTKKAYKMTIKYGQGTGSLPSGTPLPTTPAERELNIITYEQLTPLTVANFLEYVNAHDYDDALLHRAVNDFPDTDPPLSIDEPAFRLQIIQGGGFKYLDSPEGQWPRFNSIAPRPSPRNEPGISNIRGTIAMAKVAGLPDSATHDFFFNFANNSLTLDYQNSGFTVFARIAGSGNSVPTHIASLQRNSAEMPFNVQVVNPTSGSSVVSAFDSCPITGTGELTDIIDSTRLVAIKSIVPIPDGQLITYATPTSSDTSKVTVSATATELVINALATGQSTINFNCTDLDGQSASQIFTVKVESGYTPATITDQPADVSGAAGTNAIFSVTTSIDGTAADNFDRGYQWYKNDEPLSNQSGKYAGVTTKQLTVSNIALADQGDYHVVIHNQSPRLVSIKAKLTVTAAPEVYAFNIEPSYQPGAQIILRGRATGNSPITLQWFKGSAEIPGATQDSYTISPASANDNESYILKATNDFGTTSSNAITVNVLDPDTDHDGLSDGQELLAGTDINSADSDGDGFGDGIETSLGTNPKNAKSNPSKTRFVAQKEQSTLFNSIGMKYIPAGTGLPDRLNADTPVNTDAYWLGTTEVTNGIFAAVLQYAVKTLDVAEITTESGRQAIRYPKTTGEIICYLASSAVTAATPPSCDISVDTATISFLVDQSKVNQPVRAISWRGAYLATVVLNHYHGSTAKNTANYTFDPTANGYYLPSYAEWEVAARGGYAGSPAVPNLTYPTGATNSAALSWFGQTSSTAKPKDVARFKPSLLGLFDLAGNVAEWISNNDGTQGYLRGGSYADAVTATQNTAHEQVALSSISPEVGIRLALKAPGLASMTRVTPENTILLSSESLLLSVTGMDSPHLSYLWKKNGKDIKGQTQSTLTVPTSTKNRAGVYSVQVLSHGVLNTGLTLHFNVTTLDQPLAPILLAFDGKPAALDPRYTLAKPDVTLKYKWEYIPGVLTNPAQPLSTGTEQSLIGTKRSFAPATVDQNGYYRFTMSGPDDETPRSINYKLEVQRVAELNQQFLFPHVVGGYYQYQVSFNNNDSTRGNITFSAKGLPRGLKIDPQTGVISGRPLSTGNFAVVVTATNAAGKVSTNAISLTIERMDLVGMVARHTGTVPSSVGLNDDLGGRLALTTTSSGALTGSVSMGTKTYKFKGTMDQNFIPLTANMIFDIPRVGENLLRVTLQFNVYTRMVTGTVSEVNGNNVVLYSAQVNGWGNAWGNTGIYTYPNDYAGGHNVAFKIATEDVGVVSIPQGDSYARFIVDSRSGKTTYSGKLADGTAITGSHTMGPVGQHLVYNLLYASKGSVLGTVSESAGGTHTFTDNSNPAQPQFATIKVSWLKKNLGTASPVRSYKTGFSTTMSVSGGIYNPTASNRIFLELPDTNENARLTFNLGGLSLGAPPAADHFTQNFTLDRVTKLTFPSVNLQLVRITKIDSKTGIFEGSFRILRDDTVPEGLIERTATFSGLAIGSVASNGAYIYTGQGYFNLETAPTTNAEIGTTPVSSGRCIMSRHP